MTEFENDREYLENKYHRQDQPFNPHMRWFYHGYEYDASTGLTDEEIEKGLQAMIPEFDSLPHPVAKAKAVKYVLDNTRIDINEHDFFIGIFTWARQARKYTTERWDKEIFGGELKDVRKELDLLYESGTATLGPDYDHVVPDFDALMSLGFTGILNRAKEYRKKLSPLTDEQAAYFDAIEIEYGATLDIIKRLCEYAKTKTHSKAKAVANCLEHLYTSAPTNTYEALQLIFIYFMIAENVDCYQVRSFGNGLDHTLRPFWKNDIASGKFTEEELKNYLAYFMMQFTAIGNYWGHPFFLGGTDENGNSTVDEVSWAILKTYRSLHVCSPKMQMKVGPATPRAFVDYALDMVRCNDGNLAFCCEPGHIKAIMNYGATYDEARTFDIRGCCETGIKANEVSTSIGAVNVAKAMLYAISDGFDPKLKLQLAPHTGKVSSFKTFDDFYFAVTTQIADLIERAIRLSLSYERFYAYINPSPYYSATITYSLERGVDAYAKAVKFNNTALGVCGIATAVDSIMAVKELVYDKKICTFDELKAALDADWNGYEKLRMLALSLKHKYGNDDSEADEYAARLMYFITSKINNRPNAKGGVYKSVFQVAMHFMWQGEKTQASPDGRKCGDELSKNATCSVGMDRNGASAFVASTLKLGPTQGTEAFCIDVSLLPSAVSGSDGLAAMHGLLDVYMKNDGLTMQFNVLNPDALRKAQEEPERNKGLMIRVAGWNVLWNNLSKKEQDAYIRRAEANG